MPVLEQAVTKKQVHELKPMELVDDTKTYRLILQMGPNISWRNLKGGVFTNIVEVENPGTRSQQQAFKAHYEPAIHETPPIMGTTANGLIQRHSDWLKENAEKSFQGPINRQLAVLRVRETKEDPSDGPKRQGVDKDLIGAIVNEAVKGAMDAMLASQKAKA